MWISVSFGGKLLDKLWNHAYCSLIHFCMNENHVWICRGRLGEDHYYCPFVNVDLLSALSFGIISQPIWMCCVTSPSQENLGKVWVDDRHWKYIWRHCNTLQTRAGICLSHTNGIDLQATRLSGNMCFWSGFHQYPMFWHHSTWTLQFPWYIDREHTEVNLKWTNWENQLIDIKKVVEPQSINPQTHTDSIIPCVPSLCPSNLSIHSSMDKSPKKITHPNNWLRMAI